MNLPFVQLRLPKCPSWGLAARVAVIWLVASLTLSCRGADPAPKPIVPVVPLARTHAHNDYEHARPLLDALDCGFCSIEADVWLRKGELLVGHLPFDLKPERTLEKLYLDPLRERAKANGGKVYKDGPRVHLMIDVKTDAKDTYAALDKVLAKYADILTVTRDGKVQEKAVTVVISGNCDRDAMKKQAVRFAGIDGRPVDLDSDASAALVPWISERWGAEFRWDGQGAFPDGERAKLKTFVAKAHNQGRLVRFWSTPEKPEVWKELLAADVDLINTDKLAELREFLLKNPPEKAKP